MDFRTTHLLLFLSLSTSSYAGPCADEAVLPTDAFILSTNLEELGEIIVTDTKTEQSSRSVTQSIRVVGQSEFERIGENRRNLAELLQYASGQFVNVLSRNDANWGSYAGLGAKYNTYMLDGLPIDSFADAMSLDPWAFDRIEVQKGPASILYSNYMTMDFAGTESPLAGTTNFILKDRIDCPQSRIQLGGGSYDTQNGRFYHQNRNGDVSYFLGGYFEKSDYVQYGEEGSWLQTTEEPDYRKTKIYGKIHWAPSERQSLSLFLHRSDHTGDMGRPNRDFDHRYQTANVKYHADLTPAAGLDVHGGIRDYRRSFGNDAYPLSLADTGTGTTRQKIIPLDVTLGYRHGENSVLTLGSDAQWTDYETYEQTAGTTVPKNRVQGTSNSLFLQEKAVFGEWIARGGIRYNRVRHTYDLLGGITPSTGEASWSATLWNVGLRWNATDTLSWYANTGTGFMTPSAKQVGGTITDPATDSGQLPNSSLDAEQGLGNDIGFEWNPSRRFSLGFRTFYNRVEEAIVDNVVNTALSQTRATNAARATAAGLELDLRYRDFEYADYFANFTWSDTRIDDQSNPDTDGNEIPFVPLYVANAGVTLSLPWNITGSGYVQRVGRYYDSTSLASRNEFGNYHVINAKFQKSVLRNERYGIDALLELNNLADRRYPMPWGFVDTGFNGYAAVSVIF